MAFYLQLIGCNLAPGLLYSHYMTSYMLGMPFAKVERLQTAYYLTQASMIMVLIVLVVTIYDSYDLLRSLPYGGVTAFWTIIMIYCYVLWWAVMGISMFIVGAFYGLEQVRHIIRSNNTTRRQRQDSLSWLDRL